MKLSSSWAGRISLGLSGVMAAVTTASSAPSATVSGGQARPVYREIGDWILACDNTRNCVAKFIPDDPAPGLPPTTGEIGYVGFSRSGGPNGAAQLKLGAESGFDPDKARLDGNPLGVHGWGVGEDHDRTLDGQAALSLMRAVRNGKLLSFSGTADGPQATLKGLAAILLAMDDAQGRIGNASALARPGPAPASATLQPPSPPIIHAVAAATPLRDPKSLILAVRRTQATILKARECDAARTNDDDATALNANEAVVIIQCEMAAYQSSDLVFLTPRTAPAQAKLFDAPTPPTFRPWTKDEVGAFTEASFDPKTATLSETAKGRGLADCGFSAQWTYDGHGFVVSSFSRQERCGGGAPGDWPTLFQSKVVTTR